MTNKPQALDEQMIELCPFCGSAAEEGSDEKWGSYVACTNEEWCNALQHGFSSEDRAIAAWNTRAAHSLMAAKVAERDKVIGIAADALDLADNIIAVNLGTDTPAEWNRAMRKVAKDRAALAPHPERHE